MMVLLSVVVFPHVQIYKSIFRATKGLAERSHTIMCVSRPGRDKRKAESEEN